MAVYDQNGRVNYGLAVGPKYRFNDKLSLYCVIDYTLKKNDRGWVAFDGDDIVFGQRDREILQNDITGKYAINNRMTVNLTARYYWSYSENKKFLTLQDNGYLSENNAYTTNKDRNFASWNCDLAYSWWFAPGSEMSVLYRTYSTDSTTAVEKDLGNNIKSVFNGNLTNIFSISLRYFIDYNRIKNKF
jgi:hypothetical protein